MDADKRRCETWVQISAFICVHQRLFLFPANGYDQKTLADLTAMAPIMKFCSPRLASGPLLPVFPARITLLRRIP